MSAFTLTLAETPLHLPLPKTTLTAVPFFWRRSLARFAGQSDPIASVLFSRTTTSPPGPSSGAPETAKRPAVQRGGLGAACTVGASAVTNVVAASANIRIFEPIDISVSPRAAYGAHSFDGRPSAGRLGKVPATPGRGGISSSPSIRRAFRRPWNNVPHSGCDGSQHGPYARDARSDQVGRPPRPAVTVP